MNESGRASSTESTPAYKFFARRLAIASLTSQWLGQHDACAVKRRDPRRRRAAPAERHAPQERFIGPEWLFEGKLDGIYRGITEAVADKGYHSNQVMVDLEAVGVRSYISEPDRGQRNLER